MPSHYAALLVIGILVLVGGPAFYWVFFKMDSSPIDFPTPSEAVRLLTDNDVARIESALNVRLPDDYVTFLIQDRSDATVDDTTALSDADAIIEATQEYRRGFAGLPPWPHLYVYIGDEADACPYVLDTESGRVIRMDKGNLDRAPIAEYPTFTAFSASFAHTNI
jgi:SMI1 / KNR4 family (SUKH-1)